MPRYTIEYRGGRYVILKESNPQWRILISDGIGEDTDDYIELHPIEVAYLLIKKHGTIPGKEYTETLRLIERFTSDDPDYMIRLSTYLDLRERGFKVRIFDREPIVFEVFNRGEDPLTGTSSRYIMVVPAEKSMSIDELDRALKIAEDAGKDLVLAIVDQDGDIVYYKVSATLKFKVSLRLKKA